MSAKFFRVYADHKRYLYVQVRVFDTQAEMVEDIVDTGFGMDSGTDGLMGQCSGVTHYNKSGRMTGRFAVMWINREDLLNHPTEIVSHESTRAAMRYARNKRADLSNMEGEEVMCYAQGRICREIVSRLFKLKVFE